ncbi:hypothetical protein DFH28DRAFT_921036 [Melampsora americana]|nr:hypothetical protein DFH28DRAFT_937750 [Melampsora americana]KAH9825053.1 hypothetical protein DFH28DRAFT_921036 [Melampsora americana]
MSSQASSFDFNDVVQSTPTTSRASEMIYFTTNAGSGLFRMGLDRIRARQARYAREDIYALNAQHIDPRLHDQGDRLPLVASSPRELRAIRRNDLRENVQDNSGSTNTSPRAQREIARLAAYKLSQQSKQHMRRIIRVIQSKRRNEFRVLREALGQIVNYDGPYLQDPGEKEAAAHIIRMGGLGYEFVHVFDQEAKWAWLQIRVDAL